MLRFGLVLMAVALTVGTVGCTQCDTCDDFPTPCIGPNCGYSGAMTPPGTYTSPMPTSSVVGTTTPTPSGADLAPAPAPAPADAGGPGLAPSNEPAVVPPATGPETTPPAPMTPGGAFTPPNP